MLKANVMPGVPIERRCERAVAVVYRMRKGRIEFLLVSRNSDPDQLTLPGGRIESGESLRTTAARECLEESGAKVRLLGPLVRYNHISARGVIRPTMAYLAEARSVSDSPEGRDVAWVRHKDLLAGLYDVPVMVLDVLEYAVQCLRMHEAA